MNPRHGGDWLGYQRQYGRPPLDFSASISPLGLPEGVRKAVIRSLSYADRYPDPACRMLSEKLAGKRNLAPEQMLWGNGVSDLLYRLALGLAPRSAAVTAPTFSEYEAALGVVGCPVEHIGLREETGFRLGEDCLSRIRPGLSLLVLCQPNNPTGVLTPRPLLERILERCARCGTVLAVDESFLTLTDRPEAHTLTGQLQSYPNLIIFHSFTKSHAMAGLRLGCALSGNRALLAKLSKAGPPWSVSTAAQAAGLAAMDEDGYLCRVRSLLGEQRPMVQWELEALGCRVVPGAANYLLFYTGAADLHLRLAKAGILIRSCAGFPGLGPGWYRIAIRTPEENRLLLTAMKEALYG